jgi:hypothetical protein
VSLVVLVWAQLLNEAAACLTGKFCQHMSTVPITIYFLAEPINGWQP